MGEGFLQPLVGLLQLRLDVARKCFRVGLGDRPLRDELRRVLLAHRRLLRDPRRHQRLGVGRLVLLVVAVPAIADEVDDDVVLETAAIGHPQAHGRDARLGVIGVHMDDREVEALGEVARVAGRAAVDRIGGEADLIVRDQVQRAASRVAL